MIIQVKKYNLTLAFQYKSLFEQPRLNAIHQMKKIYFYMIINNSLTTRFAQKEYQLITLFNMNFSEHNCPK
ncbi:hypothetical protein pb186bvf_002296 [Paramecium bursaria]